MPGRFLEVFHAEHKWKQKGEAQKGAISEKRETSAWYVDVLLTPSIVTLAFLVDTRGRKNGGGLNIVDGRLHIHVRAWAVISTVPVVMLVRRMAIRVFVHPRGRIVCRAGARVNCHRHARTARGSMNAGRPESRHHRTDYRDNIPTPLLEHIDYHQNFIVTRFSGMNREFLDFPPFETAIQNFRPAPGVPLAAHPWLCFSHSPNRYCRIARYAPAFVQCSDITDGPDS